MRLESSPSRGTVFPPHLHVWLTVPLPNGTERDLVRIKPRQLGFTGHEEMKTISSVAEALGLKSCTLSVLNVLMQTRNINIGDYAPEAVHGPDTSLVFILPRP